MCLPILLLLFAAMLWLGTSLNALSVATTQARHDAWKVRHLGNQADAFKRTTTGKIEKSTVVDASFSPFFDVVGDPHSEHLVFGGSWDYHQIPMDMQPNWALYRVVGVEAATLKGEAFGNVLDNFKSYFSGFDPDSITQGILKGKLGEFDGLLGQLDEGKKKHDVDSERRKGEERRKLEEKIKTQQQMVQELSKQLSVDEKNLADVEFKLWLVDTGYLPAMSPAEVNTLKGLRVELKKRLKTTPNGETRAQELLSAMQKLEHDRRRLKEFDQFSSEQFE